MSKDKKAKVDINSVHSKLADKYKIKRDIIFSFQLNGIRIVS